MVEDTVIPEPEGLGAMPLSFSSISAVTARKRVSSEGAGGGCRGHWYTGCRRCRSCRRHTRGVFRLV